MCISKREMVGRSFDWCEGRQDGQSSGLQPSSVREVLSFANAASARSALRGSRKVQCVSPNERWWAAASTGLKDDSKQSSSTQQRQPSPYQSSYASAQPMRTRRSNMR